ncbi:xylose isomerase [Alkalihalobacillus alcalophilus ATCC 27647 = CGMCC 1.3604]|uniref:Xylose isomerase n=1 Tax=Alkalihalobacillus alcalophilus ATCC 27647 = CGMCC 1.3604 TaxID=1218173 RepID=A0A094YU34_ALKAL|nr:sugar phosphate isomerase/epimerase family protein [Alkalihalobacillus alcalophilus]KGA96997.1 xylose isomerase [Alkalihalobacillus alcalophilus ATCC 27647 = CGMCC 1.3604]MED1564201.1 sugar phosphate isomerase/epimerase [Alkalihalobacillus alcalophilus]THG90270.1 xylose isomerase [Alkalihalobacillus alcalophilus ATCC 27647 = CGMCC 1.3604]
MKLSVFTVMVPDLTPSELLPLLKENGYDAVEWRYKSIDPQFEQENFSFWRNNFCTIQPNWKSEELLKLRKETEKLGIETLSVTPYLTCGDLEATEDVLKKAKLLGANMIRIGVPRYDGALPFSDLLQQAKRYVKEVEELCKQYQIKGLVETHHQTIAPSASLALRLVEESNPDHIGVLYDPGNMVHEGYEDYRMGIAMLGSYLAHVHAKNAAYFSKEQEGIKKWQGKWVRIDRGIVDWVEVMNALKESGYQGYVGMEDFSETFPSKEALAFNAQYLKSFVE